LKSYNYQDEYFGKISALTSKIEKSRIKAELMASAGVITGKVVLNLGIVSVILLGSYLIMNS
jgi:ATP-binding cassette subfamily B protein